MYHHVAKLSELQIVCSTKTLQEDEVAYAVSKQSHCIEGKELSGDEKEEKELLSMLENCSQKSLKNLMYCPLRARRVMKFV